MSGNLDTITADLREWIATTEADLSRAKRALAALEGRSPGRPAKTTNTRRRRAAKSNGAARSPALVPDPGEEPEDSSVHPLDPSDPAATRD